LGGLGKGAGVRVERIVCRAMELCKMAIVSVHVWDATGNKRQQVDMPDDAPVNRILAVLLEKMNFPQYAPDGQILSYKFHHRSSGKQLLDDQCLRDVGVKDGDVLRLQPEITAGGGNDERGTMNDE
jgi:uncharacterized ubiquitin-like protein YukD